MILISFYRAKFPLKNNFAHVEFIDIYTSIIIFISTIFSIFYLFHFYLKHILCTNHKAYNYNNKLLIKFEKKVDT